MSELQFIADEDLVIQYKDGNELAFNELYSRYADKLKRLIYYYISNNDDIDDIFHEVIIRVIKHINSFNINKTFSSWIYQIAVNCSRNYVNKSNKKAKLIKQEALRVKQIEAQDSPEEKLIADIDLKEFGNAIGALKDKFREVFILRYNHRMKYSEISDILSCSERTAKWRMKKAIENITYYLKDKDII